MGRWDFTESLRGWAVGGVVLVHCGQHVDRLPSPIKALADYSSNGVQLFFILSALLLTASTLSKPFVASEFYWRRFLRIAPMFYLAMVFYLTTRGGGPSQFAPAGVSWVDVVLTGTFLHGWRPTSFNSVVPGGWSIACEAMFYAILPLLLAFITNRQRSLILLAGSVVLAVVVALTAGVATNWFPSIPGDLVGQWAHFSILAQFPAFAAGIAIYFWLPIAEHFIPPRLAKIGVAASGLVLLGFALSGLGALTNYLAATAVLAVLVTLASVASPRWLANSVARHVGVASFSVYLIHFVVLDIVSIAIPQVLSPLGHLAVLFGSVFGVSVLLATATYRWVERPFIQLGRSRTRVNTGLPI